MADELTMTELRTEYLENPIGIDVVQPRLSWKLTNNQPNPHDVAQAAYQILVASSQKKLELNQGDLWDSGRVRSNNNLHHVYQGKPLSYGKSCWWKVRAWDQHGNALPWSKLARFSIGAWFIYGLAGIYPDPVHPGYEHFFIRPQVCGDVTDCEVTYESVRGCIESHWTIEDGVLKLTVVVPPNTTATVILPGQQEPNGKRVGQGTHQFSTILQ